MIEINSVFNKLSDKELFKENKEQIINVLEDYNYNFFNPESYLIIYKTAQEYLEGLLEQLKNERISKNKKLGDVLKNEIINTPLKELVLDDKKQNLELDDVCELFKTESDNYTKTVAEIELAKKNILEENKNSFIKQSQLLNEKIKTFDKFNYKKLKKNINMVNDGFLNFLNQTDESDESKKNIINYVMQNKVDFPEEEVPFWQVVKKIFPDRWNIFSSGDYSDKDVEDFEDNLDILQRIFNQLNRLKNKMIFEIMGGAVDKEELKRNPELLKELFDMDVYDEEKIKEISVTNKVPLIKKMPDYDFLLKDWEEIIEKKRG